MYNRKTLGPGMKPWETLALTGYFCEHVKSNTYRKRWLLRKDKRRSKTWPEISEDLTLGRRPTCQALSKALGVSCATAQVAPDPFKAIAVL